MLLRKWYLQHAVEENPAGGGGAATPPPASAGSDVDWESESDPRDEDEAPTSPPAKADSVVPKAPVAVTPPKPPAPSTPEPSTATSTPAPAPAAPVVAPSEPAPATPPAASVPPAEPTEPVAAAAPEPSVDLAALRQQEVARLTQAYAVNEEQSRQLLVEPEKAMPTLLANLHVNIMDSLVQSLQRNLPTMVQQLTQQSSAAVEAERAFFAQWPMLAKQEYRGTVLNAIKGYRSLNPKASRDEVIRAAGLHTLLTLRLPLPQELLAHNVAEPPAPSVGFSHAAPSASATPAVANPSLNAFQLLNQEFDEEER